MNGAIAALGLIVTLAGVSLAAGRSGSSSRGLEPVRGRSGVSPSYGASLVTAKQADPKAVYLTTQLGVARWAARDAAKVHGGQPVVLQVHGVSGLSLRADEDSSADDWRRSLEIMGSVKHMGGIEPDRISRLETR